MGSIIPISGCAGAKAVVLVAALTSGRESGGSGLPGAPTRPSRSKGCLKLSHRPRPVPCHSHLPPRPKPPMWFPARHCPVLIPAAAIRPRVSRPAEVPGAGDQGWAPAHAMAPPPHPSKLTARGESLPSNHRNGCSRKRKWISKMLNLDLRQSDQKVSGLDCVFFSRCGQYCSTGVICPKSQTLALSASSVSPHNDFLYSYAWKKVSLWN